MIIVFCIILLKFNILFCESIVLCVFPLLCNNLEFEILLLWELFALNFVQLLNW